MRRSSTRRRCTAALLAFLSGGTALGSCHALWRDAIFQGTEQFVLSLLDPSNFTELVDPSASAEAE